MTRREASLGGWFALFVGGCVLAFSVAGILGQTPPPPSNSLTKAALIQGLTGLFGTNAGRVIYHSIYGAGGALLAWFGLKILRGRVDDCR